MSYLFTSESVSEGHPDKVADQISDALLDEFLRRDSDSKVACETLVTTGLAVLSGEVKTNAYVDVQQVARRVINEIGYTKAEYMFDGSSCGVISSIHEQSADINRGVERESDETQGAGDQGMMFGYAVDHTDSYMPLPLDLSHKLLIELSEIRREGKYMTYLRPDAKSQVTMEYNLEGKPTKVETIVISTQHDDFVKPAGTSTDAHKEADEKMLAQIRKDVQDILIPRVIAKLPKQVAQYFERGYKLFVNPTGKFVIGGPHGDTGLTGRKIIVDTYGGKGAHGGGAFSGKDPSKVDRSAAYAMRHIAKNCVAAGLATEILVQVAYAIGVAEPMGFVHTYGTTKARKADGTVCSDSEIAQKLAKVFDLRPGMIIRRLGLKQPIYLPTASYGHMGRQPYKAEVEVFENGKAGKRMVEFFPWEKLDFVDTLRKEFGLV